MGKKSDPTQRRLPHLDDDIARQILQAAEEAARAGVQVDVREFTVEPA